MSGTRMILFVTILAACASGPTPAPQMPATAAWNDAATQEVRAQVENTMGAFVAMNVQSFKAGLAENVVAFEMDLDGKPVRLGSRDDAVRYAEEMFAQLTKMGAKLNLDIHSIDCSATSTLGWCTVEFDFKATMPDGSTMSQPSRNSIVLHKDPDGWAWTHWHSSLAVAPASPTP